MDHCSLQGIFCGDACLLACALGDALLPAISLASKAEPHWVIMFQFSMLKRPHAAQRVAVQLHRPCRNGDPPGSSARIPRGGRLRTPRPGWQRHSVRQPRFILFKKPHRYCADESSAGAPCPDPGSLLDKSPHFWPWQCSCRTHMEPHHSRGEWLLIFLSEKAFLVP